MESNESGDKHRNLANEFEHAFLRLLSGEKFDLYAADVNGMFEVVAAHLLAEAPDRKWCWYDGVVDLTASVRKRRQVEFTGGMWVGDVGDARKQWREDFRAVVTDKRVTKQGVWITLWIGSSRAEGNLETAFGLTD